eukprot:7444464-Alexandrium_andersonii.AAC.1
MGFLELAPSPEQDSKHRAPLNSVHNTSGKHDFANDFRNNIIQPPEAGAVCGPLWRAVERRRNQRQSSAQRLPKP